MINRNSSRITSISALSKNVDYLRIPRKYRIMYNKLSKDKYLDKLGGMKFIFVMSFIYGFYLKKKQKISSSVGQFRLRVFDEIELWTILSLYSYEHEDFIEKKILSKKLTDKQREKGFREALKELEQYAAAGFPDFKKNWEKYEANSIYDLMENIDNLINN